MKIFNRTILDKNKDVITKFINKASISDEAKRYLIYNFTTCVHVIFTEIWNVIFTHPQTDKCYRQRENGVGVSKVEMEISHIALQLVDVIK